MCLFIGVIDKEYIDSVHLNISIHYLLGNLKGGVECGLQCGIYILPVK